MAAWSVALEIANQDANKHRGRKPKVKAKHKLRLGDEESNEEFHKYAFKSVRNKSLQKLMLVWYVFMYNSKSDAPKELMKRYREKNQSEEPQSLGDIISMLKPEDVMRVLHCNRRTAIQYIQVLRFIRPTMDMF